MRRAFLALVYISVVGLIVFLADRRESQFLFGWIRSFRGADKVGHFLIMGGFAFVMNYALSCRRILIASKAILLGNVIVAAVVTLEEFSQIFIKYRTFDLVDLTFDFLGIWLFGKLAGRLSAKEEQTTR